MIVIFFLTLHYYQSSYIFFGSEETVHMTGCECKQFLYMFIIHYLVILITFLKTAWLLNKKRIYLLSKRHVIFKHTLREKHDISRYARHNRRLLALNLSLRRSLIFNFVFLDKLHDSFDDEHVWLPQIIEDITDGFKVRFLLIIQVTIFLYSLYLFIQTVYKLIFLLQQMPNHKENGLLL